MTRHTPFSVGMPAQHVALIERRTGRRRTRMTFDCGDESYDWTLGRDGKPTDGERVNLADVDNVSYFYTTGEVVTMQRAGDGRGQFIVSEVRFE